MRNNNSTDRPLLIAVAENKDANRKAEQITTHCPGIYNRLLVLFAHIINFSSFSSAAIHPVTR